MSTTNQYMATISPKPKFFAHHRDEHDQAYVQYAHELLSAAHVSNQVILPSNKIDISDLIDEYLLNVRL